MAAKIDMELFGGASGLDAGNFLQDRDLRDYHVGAQNASGQGTHNRLAVPWAGAAYTIVNGNWVKVAGRPGALTGDELESQYPNLAQQWRNFAQAQSGRDSNPGSWDALMADLRRVASDVSNAGEMAAHEGRSLRAQKARMKR